MTDEELRMVTEVSCRLIEQGALDIFRNKFTREKAIELRGFVLNLVKHSFPDLPEDRAVFIAKDAVGEAWQDYSEEIALAIAEG